MRWRGPGTASNFRTELATPINLLHHSMSMRQSLLTLPFAALVALSAPAVIKAQVTKDGPAPAPRANLAARDSAAKALLPATRPADVASLDAIIAALYDVISGPAGQKRDWDRFRSLFYPGARLIPTGKPPNGPARAFAMTPDEYVSRSGALEERGFFERELSRTVEEFGSVTHAFSTYDSKRKADDPAPFARGINSIQLLNDGSRWWVVTIFWDAERSGLAIPDKYLRK